MSEVILLDGGLDTASSPLAAKRGGLRACQNYEVGTERGYRRIDGIEIYDGTINPNINNYLRITFRSECASTALSDSCVEQPITFPNPYGYLGESIVTGFSSFSVGESKIYVLDVALSKIATTTLATPFIVNGVTVEPFLDVDGNVLYDISYSLGEARLQSDVNTDAHQPLRAPDVSRTQRVGGLFWRNDQLYAIVDCVKIGVTEIVATGTSDISRHIPGNGAYLYSAGSTVPFGEVLYKKRDSFTYIPINPGSITVGDTITIGDGVARYTVDSFDPTEASVLWVATHGGIDGWKRVETNRIASYKQTNDCTVASFFEPYNRFAFNDTVAESVASSSIPVDSVELAADGAVYWLDQDEVMTDDGLFASYGSDIATYYAGLSAVSSPLRCRFDFTGIPSTARVVGITVNIKKRKSEFTWSNGGNIFSPVAETAIPSVIYDEEIRLVWTGASSENKASAANWVYVPGGAFTASTYGGVSDLWGSNISLSDLLSPDFFLTISVRNGLATATHKAFDIQFIDMQVHYISQSNKVYIYRADVLPGDGINREVVIPHRTVESGLIGTKTAQGQIIIERPTEARDPAFPLIPPPSGLEKDVIDNGVPANAINRGYVTAPGDELRTAKDGAGDLIAVLTTADGPQYLPASRILTDAGKRWYSINASPYAQDNSDISVICNGVEQAYVWDDRNLMPISTGLDKKYEKPTFCAYWGSSLVLGYDTGTITFSDIGDPLSFTGGAAGAAEIDMSDKITGILALKGEALGIFTERTIQALYGDDTTNLSRKIISPNSGAIPYTVCDMGAPVFTDFRGIGTVDAVQEYGDFQRGRWSYNIQNYLTPIIQNEMQFLTEPAKVICAYPVRNKNQYRLCFSDASIVTMTLVGPGLEQQFTTQSIFTRTQEGEKVPMAVLAVEHGVSSAGRDVIFCSLDSGFHDGYVFRVDQGNKFPAIEADNVGVEIEAYIDLNFNHPVDRPSSTARIDRLAVYGSCKGYATLGFNQSVFYGDPGPYTVEFIAGDVLATADKPAKYFMSMIDSGCEARDISFRISSTELEASHTLQAIEVFQTIDGQRKDDKR